MQEQSYIKTGERHARHWLDHLQFSEFNSLQDYLECMKRKLSVATKGTKDYYHLLGQVQYLEQQSKVPNRIINTHIL